MAEAETSAHIVLFTLTYKEEPEEFRAAYKDVQAFLKRVRRWAEYHYGMHFRFFCAGERGTLGNRLHWHVMIFADKRVEWPEVKAGELHPHWPHGWLYQKTPRRGQDARQACRYVCKYITKGTAKDGEKFDAFFRCSLKPGLGREYILAWARHTAKSALPPNGYYQLPNERFTKGEKAGSFVRFEITGATRTAFIKEWHAEWDRCGHGPKPGGAWLLRFDPDTPAVIRGVPFAWAKPDAERTTHMKGPGPWQGRSAHLILDTGGFKLWLEVRKHGLALLHDDYRNVSYMVGLDIGDTLRLNPEDRDAVNLWLARNRPEGFGWNGAQAEKDREAERRQRREAIRAHAIQSINVLRERHGIAESAETDGTIYAVRFDPERDRLSADQTEFSRTVQVLPDGEIPF